MDFSSVTRGERESLIYQNKDISSQRKMDHVVMAVRRYGGGAARSREFCDYKSAYSRNARRAGREVKSLTSPRVIRLGSGKI